MRIFIYISGKGESNLRCQPLPNGRGVSRKKSRNQVVCYAEQETSIPSDATLFNIELLQEGQFPEITAIETKDKHLADNICQALYSKERIIEVDFSRSDNELADLYESVINDNPMLYDVLGTVYIEKIDGNKYNIYPQYKKNRSNKISLFTASDPINEAVNDILAQVNDEMTDVEKMLAVHDYILTHYEYDYTYSYYYTNEFFTYKRGTCNAHALTFKYIMDRIGIECSVVVSESMNHAWNMVYIDGNYYHIDVTWDDDSPDEFGHANHRYFMLSDKTISDSRHNHYGWSGTPKATDTKYDSYVWTAFELPMQYYDGYWYTAQSGKIYQCSVQNNTKTELGSGDEVGIYEGTMYITDSSYNLYTIPMDKISNFKPLLNDCLKDLQSLENLNGLFIEDGYLKYAIADDEFYEYEYRDDDQLHAVHDNYYQYRYFYSIDLTEYKDTYRIGDNITWTVDANGTLKIQGFGDMYSSPENNSFLGYYTDSVKSLVIENGITSIRSYAFYDCTSLKSITIGTNVENIGDYAFYGCTSLSQINWNAKNCAGFSYNNVFSYAGQNGNGISVLFGNTTEGIPANIFNPDNTFPYNDYSEDKKPKIISVQISDNVKSIGARAFWGCNGITSLTIGNNVESINGTIGDYAFYNCTELTSVHIGDSIEHIGEKAFLGCTGLTNLTISNNVKSIGWEAFKGCTSLSQINWNAKNCADFAQYGNHVFSYAGQNGDGVNVVFGDTVERIPAYILYPYYYSEKNQILKIKSITIGSNVESIGDGAFKGCTELLQINWNAKNCADFDGGYSNMFYNAGQNGDGINVIFGDTVERIPAYVFNDDAKITSVYIGNNVKSIGAHAFYNCTGLTSLTIGDNVESIGYEAFSGCTSLTQINWNAKNCADYSGNEYYGFFPYAGQDGEGIRVVFGDTVEKIPDYIFYGNANITSVHIGNNVKSIGDRAFSGCTGSITLPDSIEYFGVYAFYNCTGLTSLTIGDNVESIGDGAFSGCTSLTQINWNAKNCADFSGNRYDGVFCNAGQNEDGVSVVFGDTVERIPAYIFYCNAKITSVHIGDNVKSIGNYAFYNCTGSIVIPDSIENFGEYAFFGCTGLTSLTIGVNVESIGKYAFYGCTSLTQINWNAIRCADFGNDNYVFWDAGQDGDGINVIFGDTVKRIPAYIFIPHIGSSIPLIKITGITIGNNVKSIGAYAFYDCTGLTRVTIPHNVKNIEKYAFYGCDRLKNIYYNGNSDEWQKLSSWAYYYGNEPLINATKHYFAYVTLVDKNGDEICKEMQNLGTTADISSMITVPDDCIMVLYSDKEWTTVFDTNEQIYENTTLYPVVMKLNNIEITGTKNVTLDGNDLSQRITFVTDKEAKYFVCTVKYPTNLNLKPIISGNYEIEQSSETIGGYNYLYLTCIYNGEGNIPINTIQSPVEFVFDTSENIVSNDVLTLEILDDAVLADNGGNSYMFSNIENAEIRIEKVLASGIEISGEEEVVDSKTTYTASVLPQNTTNKAVKWSVSDTAIATISQSGQLTPIKTGTVKIRATAKDGSGVYAEKTVSVTVIKKVKSISISGADAVSNRANYTVSVFPEDADDKSVMWSVSDETIATISKDGVLTPIKTGNVTIRATATDGSGVFAEKTVSVTVIKKVSRISIAGADTISSEETYIATVLPEDAANKSVEWSVSDESIATISQDGKLTPVKTGSVIIKATAKDGSGVYGTKIVSVNVPATVTSITSNIGTWDAKYSPLHNNYTIYVPKDTTSVRITAMHSGTLKSADNQTFINNVAKTVVLSSDKTVLTLNYSCEGYSDNIYTITIIKLEKGTITNISEDGKTFVVTPINIETGKIIILALYENSKLVDLILATYEGETLSFTTSKSYEEAKVMVWDNLHTLKPVCDAEIIKK